jgi:hypothetical protein
MSVRETINGLFPSEQFKADGIRTETFWKELPEDLDFSGQIRIADEFSAEIPDSYEELSPEYLESLCRTAEETVSICRKITSLIDSVLHQLEEFDGIE